MADEVAEEIGEGGGEEEESPGRAEHRRLVERQLREMVMPQEFEKDMMRAEDGAGVKL